jgi:uncharacterized protein
MILLDVNLYVYAHREDSPRHTAANTFFEKLTSSGGIFGYSPLALSGFLRIITHPRIFNPPTDVDTALRFCQSIRDFQGAVRVVPGTGHWSIFQHLILSGNAKGNLIPDAWFAALAIEHGCTWATTDRDYSRFPGLKVEYPLA